MALNPSNRSYEIMTDGELANILHHFEDSFIIDIVTNNIKNIYRPYNNSMSNLVSSYEMELRQKMQMMPEFSAELNSARERVLDTIIMTICANFNISINNVDTDKYTIAYYLYEFFVANFTQNLTTFLSELIISQSSDIYKYMGFGELKKGKDTNSTYTKKIFADPTLGTVVVNLDKVLLNIINQDIRLSDIINCIYGINTPTAFILNNIIMDNGNFYKSFFCRYISDEVSFPTMMTMIKLEIQQRADIINIDINKGE